jgi:multicomponent Na+:H+ antiporter subunit E
MTDTNNNPAPDAGAQIHHPPAMIVTFVVRTVLLTLLWWLLNGSDLGSWIIGAPCVLVGAAVSLKLAPPRRWRWRPLQVIHFVPFFLKESLRGGIDVSLRVVQPRMPVHPTLVHYTTKLPRGLPRLLFLNVVSLLPGTLSADLQNDQLTLHVLDADSPVGSELQRIEERISAMFDTAADTLFNADFKTNSKAKR